MEIKYEIKGITLNVNDLMELHHYYEAACTAEYLMENYGISKEDKALSLGYEVRRLMDKYGYLEEDAIAEVLESELPTELYVNYYDIDAEWYNLEEQEQDEAVSDYLSDEYGFCHRGFEYEEIGEQIHITNIEWDEEE